VKTAIIASFLARMNSIWDAFIWIISLEGEFPLIPNLTDPIAAALKLAGLKTVKRKISPPQIYLEFKLNLS
jgi:hypothetical protein